MPDPPHHLALDRMDRRLLAALAAFESASQVELARQVGISPSRCSKRLKRLREAGLINRSVAVISAEALGGVEAYITLWMRSTGPDAIASLQRFAGEHAEIASCCSLLGHADFLLIVRTADTAALARLRERMLVANPQIERTVTSISLRSLKCRATDDASAGVEAAHAGPHAGKPPPRGKGARGKTQGSPNSSAGPLRAAGGRELPFDG